MEGKTSLWHGRKDNNMFNLVRWYNQNRGKFWTVVLIIFAIIFLVQLANNFYKNNSDKDRNKYNTSSTNRNTINNSISGKLEGSTSLVEGSIVSSKNLEAHTSVIDTFIKFCNNGDIGKAYNLLTDECKEEVFPSLESFKNKYYNNVFNTYKTYSLQNWFGDTYKIKLTEDSLTTGKVNSNSRYLQEYMTVVEKDSDYKLNINNYVGRTIMNKTTKTNGITITVLEKETYMDYSEYTVKISNTSDNTILLDNGEKTDTIYLLDTNNLKEYANTGEIIYTNLQLASGASKTYTFKFSNTYSNTRVMKSLIFEKVIMDYDEYNKTNDKRSYSNFIKLVVNV